MTPVSIVHWFARPIAQLGLMAARPIRGAVRSSRARRGSCITPGHRCAMFSCWLAIGRSKRPNGTSTAMTLTQARHVALTASGLGARRNPRNVFVSLQTEQGTTTSLKTDYECAVNLVHSVVCRCRLTSTIAEICAISVLFAVAITTPPGCLIGSGR